MSAYMFKVTVIGDDMVGKTTLETYLKPFREQFEARQLEDNIKKREKKIEKYHILKENSKSTLKGRIIDWLCKRVIKEKENFQNRLKSQEKLYHEQLKINRTPLGVSFCKKVININKDKFKLMFWILDPSHFWMGMNKNFIHGSKCVTLIYDITNAKSLEVISKWVPLLNERCRDIPILLVGNKSDLEVEREVSKENAMAFKEKYNFTDFMEISLKESENVENLLKKSA